MKKADVLDLQKFCSKDAMHMPWGLAPFNQSGHTYATDGHVMICVPLRADILDDGMGLLRPVVTKKLPAASTGKWYPVPPVNVETCKRCAGKVVDFFCFECAGHGVVTLENEFSRYSDIECGSCDGEGEIAHCPYCSGTGVDAPELVIIGPSFFKANKLDLIKDLPGIEISPTGPNLVALLRFDGGTGWLMPALDKGAK